MTPAMKFGIVGLLSASATYAALAPSHAEAYDCSITYSTGPLENEVHKPADFALVKILNNAAVGAVGAQVKAFDLNGSKQLIDEQNFIVPAGASDFFVVEDLAPTFQYEIQVTLTGDAARKALVTVFPEEKNHTLVAAHRVLHSELSVVKTTCGDK